MIEAKFLAVARAENILSGNQVRYIQAAQRACNEAQIPLRVGDLAVYLLILTEEERNRILALQDKYKAEKRLFEDPVYNPESWKRLPQIRISVRWGSIILIILSLIFAIIHGKDWRVVGIVFSVEAAIVGIVYRLFPELLDTDGIVLNRVLRWSLILLAPVAVVYCFYTASLLRLLAESGPVTLSGVASAWRRFFYGELVVALSFIVLVIISVWRHYEIWTHETRSFLTQLLILEASDAVASKFLDQTWTTEDSAKQAELLLTRAARIMSYNIWTRFLAKCCFFWSKERSDAIESVSIWYLEPALDGSRVFHIKCFAAPEAKEDVLAAFNALREIQYPVYLDTQRFREALNNCYDQTTGKFDKEEFRKYPGRESFISLSGYVYATKRGIPSGDPRTCLAYTGTNMEELKRRGLQTSSVARWLDFLSLAAYPVFKCNSTNPIGVLIAFRPVVNAIIPEDQEILVTLSCQLGLLLTRTQNDKLELVQ
jgi:hypothetical protein